MTLQFEVTGQHIVWVNNTEYVVADSRNYLKAVFDLSEEWTYPVTVLFKGGCKVVPCLLTQAGEEITVPAEVIKPRVMIVSCYCGDLLTTDSARVEIRPSGYMEDTSPPVPPTPDLYQKLIEHYSSYALQKPKGDGKPWQTVGFNSENEIAWINPPVMDGTKTPGYQDTGFMVNFKIDIANPLLGEFLLPGKMTYVSVLNRDERLLFQFVGTPAKIYVNNVTNANVSFTTIISAGVVTRHIYDVQTNTYTAVNETYRASQIDKKFNDLPKLTMTVTFDDDTTRTYTLYGQAVPS